MFAELPSEVIEADRWLDAMRPRALLDRRRPLGRNARTYLGLVRTNGGQSSLDTRPDLLRRHAGRRRSARRLRPCRDREYAEVGAWLHKFLIGVVPPVREELTNPGEVLGVLGLFEDALPLPVENGGDLGR